MIEIDISLVYGKHAYPYLLLSSEHDPGEYHGRHRLGSNWKHKSIYGAPCTWWEFKQPPIKINLNGGAYG